MKSLDFLSTLEGVIQDRLENAPAESYTARLAAAGRLKIAQKLGEEAVELAIATAAEDEARVISESADLIYHLMVLLQVRGIGLADVVSELESRHS